MSSAWRASARTAVAWLVGAAAVALSAALAARWTRDEVHCAPGFVEARASCVVPAGACPPPLEILAGACRAPAVRVRIPAARFVVGPSDWEAEGRVAPRTVETSAFAIDAFEASTDGGLPKTGVTRDEADAWCKQAGGRLPTEDEWIAAASSGAKNGNASRYPWGDTGAVCRRAAWGTASGPCSTAGVGPSAVGSHPSGDSPLGVHDLAGNVAEWVAAVAAVAAVPGASSKRGVAHGGSWRSALATELRTWSRVELDPSARDPAVGFRCVYDVAP